MLWLWCFLLVVLCSVVILWLLCMVWCIVFVILKGDVCGVLCRGFFLGVGVRLCLRGVGCLSVGCVGLLWLWWRRLWVKVSENLRFWKIFLFFMSLVIYGVLWGVLWLWFVEFLGWFDLSFGVVYLEMFVVGWLVCMNWMWNCVNGVIFRFWSCEFESFECWEKRFVVV